MSYAIILSGGERIGKRPGTKLAWLVNTTEQGHFMGHVASLTSIPNPKWSKTKRFIRKQNVLQVFGKNVLPSRAEIIAARARLKPIDRDPETGAMRRRIEPQRP